MNDNLFRSGLVYETNPEGLILPYKLVGRTDLEVLEDRYRRLGKYSYGCIVRLGIRVN